MFAEHTHLGQLNVDILTFACIGDTQWDYLVTRRNPKISGWESCSAVLYHHVTRN
jgi:hypothetical protein